MTMLVVVSSVEPDFYATASSVKDSGSADTETRPVTNETNVGWPCFSRSRYKT